MPANYSGGPGPAPAKAAPPPARVALPPILPAPKGGNRALKGLETAPPVNRATPAPSRAPAGAPRTFSQGTGAPPIIVNQSKAQLNLGRQQLSQKLLNESMTGAAIDTLLHGHFGQANLGQATGNPQPSELQQTVSKIAHQDPVYNLVTGHPGRAAQLAYDNPLNAALDATGVYGVAGRAAGAVARAGKFGDAAAQAAQRARSVEVAPPLTGTAEVAPGRFPGTTDVHPYSANLATQIVQKAVADHLPGSPGRHGRGAA
jgi:hypothetical protein